MSKERPLSEIRKRIDLYTTAVILSIATIVFLIAVPLLPGTPILQVLLGVGLGISALRRPVWAAGVLAVLAFLSIFYQLIHFGLIKTFISAPNVFIYFVNLALVLILLASFIVNLIGAHNQPTSFALALLAASLMLTPYYWLAIGVIVIAPAMAGAQKIKSSVGTVTSTFVVTIIPLIMMANAVDFNLYSSSPSLAQVNWGSHIVSPIIFSYLSNLVKAFAPPLLVLNIFGGLPISNNSAYLNALPNFISYGGIIYLLIPIIVLALIFSSAASIAGLAESAIMRFQWNEKLWPRLMIIIPLVATVGTSAAFIALTYVLAPLVPFQTDLLINGGLNSALVERILLGATIMGVAFSVREIGVQRVERVEFAKKELSRLLSTAEKQIHDVNEMVYTAEKAAPTVQLSGIKRQISEHQVYINDIKNSYNQAGLSSLKQWIIDLNDRIIPSIASMPETIRVKIIEELNKLATISMTYNDMLKEANLNFGYSNYSIRNDMSFTGALSLYSTMISDITSNTMKLYEGFKSTINAFNLLMGKEIMTTPIDPKSLLESGDYPTAMKLVSEDYWVGFNITQEADFKKKCDQLASKVAQLKGTLDERTYSALSPLIDALRDVKPVNSSELLLAVQKAISAYVESLNEVKEEFDRMQRLIRTLMPETLKAVQFETVGLAHDLEKLAKGASELLPSLDDLTDFTGQYTDFMQKLKSLKEKDTRTIMVLAHYNLARAYISSLIKDKNRVPLSELPFQKDAAIMYIKLMSEETHKVKYDDLDEELVVLNA